MKPLVRNLLQVLGTGVAVSVLTVPLALAQQDPTKIEKIEVTGSSIKRVLEEQALPVTIVTRQEIERSGATNLEQLVQAISSSSTAGAVTGSALAGMSSFGISTASLRGLGSNRTLILLNGRRMAPFGIDSQSVDLNSIPMSAIERVEILNDGASSIYGSEAIAGVMNFITRQDFKGAEASINYGTPTHSGGGQVKKASVVFGVGEMKTDGYNFMLNYAESKSEALFGRDREFSKTGNQPPFLAASATGQGNVEGVWVPGTANRAALVGSASKITGALNAGGASYYGNPAVDDPAGCSSIRMFKSSASLAGGAADGRFRCQYDSAADVGLFPNTDQKNLLAAFKAKLSSSATLFGQFNWNSNTVLEAYQPSPVRTSFLTTDTAFAGSGIDPALVIFPGNPNYPTAWLNAHGLGAFVGKPLAVTMRAFDAGMRTERDVNTQNGVVFGVEGNWMNWDYQGAITRNESNVNGGVTAGYFSQLALVKAVNTLGNTAGNYWNPWSLTQPAALASALSASSYVGPTAGGQFKSTGADLKVSGEIGRLSGGAIGAAFGASLRKDQFAVTVPDILGLGDIAGLGGAVLPQTGYRNIQSGFGEMVFPFRKDFEATASVRMDHYDDLKRDASPVTEKVSLRWAPVKSLVARGSWGTGFRAPSLAELHTPTVLGTSEEFTDPLDVAGGAIQVNALNGGNPDLKPEKSRQYSLGLVFTPISNVRASIDYFNTEIKDMIVAPTAIGLLNAFRAGHPLFGPTDVILADPADPLSVLSIDQRVHNAAKANFEGIDLSAHWNDKFAIGNLGVDYNSTVMTKARLQTLSGIENGVGTMVDPDGAPLTLTGNGVILRYKHALAFNWSMGPWAATLIQNHTSGYRSGNNQVDGEPHYMPAVQLYDVNFAFTGVKGLRLAVGSRNVFNKQPPVFVPAANFFQYGYDPSMYDPRARFIYATATYKFL
jgi:iron complex outermembrane receptor protein